MHLPASIGPAVLLLGLAAATTPAQAFPNCIMDGGPGLRVSIYVGTPIRGEAEQAEYDKLRLRGVGVNAATAERTPLGCIKVTRRDANGRWITEYYNAETLEYKPLVSSGPLNLRLP